MIFSTPVWLIALAPWAAATIWLLLGQRRRALVPFLPLWPRDDQPAQRRRGLRIPPIAIAAAIFAMLLAILAAAGPAIPSAPAASPANSITILVDRGTTMSARGNASPRFKESAASAAENLHRAFPSAAVDLILLPDTNIIHTTIDRWTDPVSAAGPTAFDTRDLITQKTGELLATTIAPVIVISDLPIDIDNPRLIQIAPTTAVENVGITQISARERPTPQVMLTLHNQSPRTKTHLTITSGDKQTTSEITLPPRGEDRNYFVDLPSLADFVTARIEPADAFEPDDQAHLMRNLSTPILEPADTLSPALEAMCRAYSLHYRDNAGKHIAIVHRVDQLPSGQPGVTVASEFQNFTTRPAGPIDVVQHPITADVRWPMLLDNTSLAPLDRPGDWTILVTAGGQPAVAIKSDPVRQAWVGIESESWASKVDYVVFWSNLFDWLGEAKDQFTSYPINSVPIGRPPILQPGLVKENNIILLALNSPPVRFESPPSTDWQTQLTAASRDPSSRRPISAPILLAALGAMVLSLLTWKPSLPSPGP